MVVDRKLSEAELFQVVGAGWKQQESEKRKKTFQEKLKGKPVFSAFLLFLIVLGCVFANVVANHDPSGFYLLVWRKGFSGDRASGSCDHYCDRCYLRMHQRNSRAKGGLGSDAVYGNVRKYSDASADPDPVSSPSGR